MKYIRYIFVSLVTIFIVNIAWAYSSQMTPTPSERLLNPIALTDICSEVRIVEWRGVGPLGITKNNIRQLQKHCKLAMSFFPKFVKERGYKMSKNDKLHASVCLMPVDDSPRNLNDINYRFSTRSRTYDDNGNVERIWGYFQRSTNYIYLRNSAVNRHKVVFVHEIFHAASYYYGIYDQHNGNKDLEEELMAQDFTDYIGYGR